VASHSAAQIQFQSRRKIKPAIEGRALLELRDGKLTLFPITDTDEQTEDLLNAIFDHIAEAIRN